MPPQLENTAQNSCDISLTVQMFLSITRPHTKNHNLTTPFNPL